MTYSFLDEDIHWLYNFESFVETEVTRTTDESVNTSLHGLQNLTSNRLLGSISNHYAQNSSAFLLGTSNVTSHRDGAHSSTGLLEKTTNHFEVEIQPPLPNEHSKIFCHLHNPQPDQQAAAVVGFNANLAHVGTPNPNLLHDFRGHHPAIFPEVITEPIGRPSPLIRATNSCLEPPTSHVLPYHRQNEELVTQTFNGNTIAPDLSQPHPNIKNSVLSRTTSQSADSSLSSISNICIIQTTSDPRVFVFRCTMPKCRKRTFSRWYDFNRHYNGTHAVERTVFWCPESDCNRSEKEGNRPFPRKDRMRDHAMKMHSIEEDDIRFQIGNNQMVLISNSANEE